MIQLDIGCGENKQAGWTGLDVRELEGVDIVHDVTDIPWPLEDGSVIRALASHLVEHINPAGGGFIHFMDECWRVMAVGGDLWIVTPHGYSPGYLQDPTHCNACNEATWSYFDPDAPSGLWNIYRPKPWQIVQLSWDVVGNIEVVLRKRENANGTG